MNQLAPTQASGLMPAGNGAPPGDPLGRVLSAIKTCAEATIAVPALADLLGVKTTTLNARFRREHIAVRTVGRTNFIPCQLACKLAELHKYALIGWPTLEEASKATAIKPATIKARCEKGQLEGHLDLTKRLRVNPAALGRLQIRTSANWPRAEAPVSTPPAGTSRVRPPTFLNKPAREQTESSPTPPAQVALAPVPAHEVRVIGRKDYGLAEIPTESPRPVVNRPQNRPKPSSQLCYDPDRPPCVSECRVGQAIFYGPYEGRILKVMEDPFCPKIKVHFPGHDVPEMREVLLAVGRRRLTDASQTV